MDRGRGAAQWAMVLSELAEVEVTVGFERPVWLVSWTDGPTRAMLSARAAALGGFRVGAPLAAGRLRFSRMVSPRAWALAWLDHGPPDDDNTLEALAAVEEIAGRQAYPARRPVEAVAAADLLVALAGGSEYRMGDLLAAAAPAPARPPAGASPADLPGRVTSIRWPGAGPPAGLLGHGTATPGRNETQRTMPGVAGGPVRPVVCAQCGRALAVKPTGRPAVYCSATCRSRARRGHKPAPGP